MRQSRRPPQKRARLKQGMEKAQHTMAKAQQIQATQANRSLEELRALLHAVHRQRELVARQLQARKLRSIRR